MSKYLKMFIYVIASHMFITFINFLLLCLEFMLANPPVTDHFPGNLDIDMIIWILIAISAVFTVSAYIFVGSKIPRTSSAAFNITMILIPSVFTCVGCILMEFGSFLELEAMTIFLDSLFGIFIWNLYDTTVKYSIAILPSVFMLIGYIIKSIKVNN